MSAREEAKQVAQNINKIYNRKIAAAIAVSMRYAALSLQYFRTRQAGGAFWDNQTGFARDSVFSGAIRETDLIGFFMAHLAEYGVYLELANNRQNEALRPVVQRFVGRYLRDIKAIFSDNPI